MAERTSDPQERQVVETQTRVLKEAITARSADVQRLIAEEAEASAALATEQTRWADINQRLEEMERTLAGPVTRPK
jgi:hypothetical protein